MDLPGLTGLALTVLLRKKFLLLIVLPVQTKLALSGLLGGTLLSLMDLRVRREVVVTTLKIDLLKLAISR